MQYWRRNTRIVKVELYSDIAKADADSSAVFTQYGSSASQVKAENNVNKKRLPGCARQAAVAVSAYARGSTTIDATSLGVGKNCGEVLENLLNWYWSGNRYPRCRP